MFGKFKVSCGFKTIGIVSVMIILVTSIFGFLLTPMLIRSKIKSMNLKKENPRRMLWEKIPFPVTFKAYLFNITNPLEFIVGGKPRVQEIGPYVFDEWKSKNILSEDNDEDSVTFEMMNTFHFRPDLSHGLTGDEIVTIPHLLLMGGLISTQREKPALLDIAIEGFKQIFQPEKTPLLTAKAMDILFHGVEVDCDREEAEAGIICTMLGAKRGVKQINETYFAFSLLGGKNATSLGKLKVNRGINNIFEIGKVLSFDDSNSSKAFTGSCGELRGTDGSIFAPFHSKKDSYFSISPGLCRTMEFKYHKDSVFNGIPISVYSTNFGDIKSDPNQHCFCRQNDPEKCPPKGTLDNFACAGSPFIISKPHFYDGDEILLQKVDGLNPNKDQHDSYLKFELQTSTTLSIRNRNQFSMQVERVEKFDLMANLTPVILPIFWVEDGVDLPPKATNVIKYGIYLFETIANVVKFVGMIIGIIGIIYAGFRYYGMVSARKPNQDTRRADPALNLVEYF